MEEALLIIASIQGWIYVLLMLVGLVYLRLVFKWHSAVRSTQFGLERERASGSRNRAAAMSGLIALAAAATFAVSTFLVPRVPASPQPTAVPTISLLEQGNVGATSLPQTIPDGVGCSNENATFTRPEPGAEVRGLIEIKGTANIPNFAFYKIEVRSNDPNSVWQVITAGTEGKLDDTLGTWDTSLVENGVYLLQLVVTDNAGNAPLPCTQEIVVLPEGG